LTKSDDATGISNSVFPNGGKIMRANFTFIHDKTRKSGLKECGPGSEACQASALVLSQPAGLRWGIRLAQALSSMLMVAAFAQPTTAQSTYYSITDVGPMPPYHPQTFVNGINAVGQVAGYGSKTPFPGTGAFLWTPGATDGIPENPQMKDLGNFYGGDYWFSAQAWGLNNRGQVVGEADFLWYSWKIPHAFLWEKGMMTDLGTLGDGLSSVARNINDLGIVVGWSDTESTKPNRNRHAFLYDTATKTMTDLGIDHSYGQSINNRKQVVGTYFPEPGTERGFFWSPATGFNDLHNLVSCGGEKSEAAAINDKMQVVGWCKDNNDVAHAFFLDLNTGEVKRLGGSHATMATALNNDGQVVGTFKYSALRSCVQVGSQDGPRERPERSDPIRLRMDGFLCLGH
jgi:probable HAF family extracellular repeat protein